MTANNEENDDPLRLMLLNDSTFAAQMDVAVGVPSLFALFSIGTNLALILATIKSKELRSSCNFLIAFDALCNVLSSLGELILFVSLVSLKSIPLLECLFIIIAPDFGMEVSSVIFLVIGVDRFLHTFFPLRMNKVRVGRLTLLLGAFAVLPFVGLTAGLTVPMVLRTPKKKVLCSFMALYSNPALGDYMSYKTLVTLPGSVLIYTAIWIRMRLINASAQQTNSEQAERRLFWSLCAIVAVMIATWAVGPLSLQVIALAQLDPKMTNIVIFVVDGSVYFLGSAVQPIIFYAINSIYRRAFGKLFSSMAKAFGVTILHSGCAAINANRVLHQNSRMDFQRRRQLHQNTTSQNNPPPIGGA